jgi:hypothetical protein
VRAPQRRFAFGLVVNELKSKVEETETNTFSYTKSFYPVWILLVAHGWNAVEFNAAGQVLVSSG